MTACLSDEALAATYVTTFDRVFVMDMLMRRIHELRSYAFRQLEVWIEFSEVRSPRVLLDIALVNSPRIADLTGTGPGSQTRHNQGYGTLVVNVAIQALRRMPASSGETRVTGLISDRRSEVTDFWRRFGFSVAPPIAGKDGDLLGKLEDLRVLERSYKAGGIFDVAMDLSRFHVRENI